MRIMKNREIVTVVLSILIGAATCLAANAKVEAPLYLTESQGLGAAVVHPAPMYTKTALQQKLEGHVTLAVYVDPQGSVYDTIITAGDPELVKMALSAVRQWKFKPFANEKGEPAKAMVPVVFNLTLPAKPTASK
jgi:protein TonB